MGEGEIQSLVEAFDGGAIDEMRVRNVQDAQRFREGDAEIVLFHFDALQLDVGGFMPRRHEKVADDQGNGEHEDETPFPQHLVVFK